MHEVGRSVAPRRAHTPSSFNNNNNAKSMPSRLLTFYMNINEHTQINPTHANIHAHQIVQKIKQQQRKTITKSSSIYSYIIYANYYYYY